MVLGLGAIFCPANAAPETKLTVASASSFAAGFDPSRAIDGDRFSVESAWKGSPNARAWWWQVDFGQPRPIGAILQINGDHPFVCRNAPRQYLWQHSTDGIRWQDLAGTAMTNEHRLFRIHRLPGAIVTRFLRLNVVSAAGSRPAVREVEFSADARAVIPFPEWTLVVNTTHDSRLPNHGQEFIPLARACAPGADLQAQQIWLDAFDDDFVRTEPRPLCGFLSGNFKDWCEVDRENWRGAQAVLRARRLPLWASCGGAQGLALLAEVGVDQPWDCPHCRDPQHPKSPIYTHIGHTSKQACGDYSGCVFERGPHWVRTVTDDPVFRGLPREFQVMESHCGQIEWPPAGWSLVATDGPGTKTKTQCLRVDGFPIYAAQFHIEMEGAPAASQQIMSNFLALARSWTARP